MPSRPLAIRSARLNKRLSWYRGRASEPGCAAARRSTCLLPCVSTPRPAISVPSMHPSRRDRPPSPRMERRGEGPPNRWGDALECASAERGNGLVRTREAPLRRLRRPGPTPHAAGEIPSRAGRSAWAARESHQCCVTASLVAAHQADDSSARVTAGPPARTARAVAQAAEDARSASRRPARARCNAHHFAFDLYGRRL
jgi:hypothetical protein